MIEFSQLTFRNILSYGKQPTTLDLGTPGSTIIVGDNGVGKTVGINALTVGLFDKPVSVITKDELINNINKKDMEVIVEWKRGVTFYKVRRIRKGGKTGRDNNVEFYERDGDNKFDPVRDNITLDSIVNTNKLIEQKLGITFELFTSIVVFSATSIPFLNLPSASQVSFIENLFNLTLLSEQAEQLKNQIRETDKNTEIQTTKAQLIERERERYQAQLQSAKERITQWDIQNKNNAAALQDRLEELTNIDVEKQQRLLQQFKESDTLIDQYVKHVGELTGATNRVNQWEEQTTKTIQSLQRELEKISGINIKEQTHFHELLADTKGSINEHNTELCAVIQLIETCETRANKAQKELTHLENEICPYCLQVFKNIGDKATVCKEVIKDNQDRLTSHTTQRQLIEQHLAELNNTKQVLDNKIVVHNIDELIKIQSNASATRSRIDDLKKTPNPHTEQLTNIEGKQPLEKQEYEQLVVIRNKLQRQLVVKDATELIQIENDKTTLQARIIEALQTTNPHVQPLKELEQVHLETVDTDEINRLAKLSEHQRFLLRLLTKKDSFVRKALLSKNLPFLNQRLHFYLRELGLPHKVVFNEDLSATISQFNRPLSFGNLSHGQGARVNLGLSLAFRDVLQVMHGFVNLCFLDEALDEGLDAQGVQLAASMLKQKAIDEKLTLFIISHRDEINMMFKNIIHVVWDKGFSSVIQNQTV